jgi:hypothetical protein
MTNNNQDVLDEFDKMWDTSDLRVFQTAKETIKAFISQKLTERTRQILEAIELPDLDPKIYSHLTGNQKRAYGQAKENLRKVKQSLKSRFLDQEVGEKE